MRDSTGRWVSVEKLSQALQQLPPGSRLYPNQLGNLHVTNESGDELLGLIDFNHGCYEPYVTWLGEEEDA